MLDDVELSLTVAKVLDKEGSLMSLECMARYWGPTATWRAFPFDLWLS